MPIDTNELRRVVAAMTPGEWLDDVDSCFVSERDAHSGFHRKKRLSYPNDFVGIAYLRNNAIALADEIDRLRAELETRSPSRADLLLSERDAELVDALKQLAAARHAEKVMPKLVESLKKCRSEIEWWAKEHSCCKDHEAETIESITSALALAAQPQESNAK